MTVSIANALIVIAKEPRPGYAKTRLSPPLTLGQAADVAAAALRDTVECVDGTPARERVLCFAGDPAGWAPSSWRGVPQCEGGLDARLAGAFAHVDGPSVLVGMDTPQLRSAHVAVFDPHRYDACFGPAADGGFWAIGFADPSAASCIRGVPMSTASTGDAQLRRMNEFGLRVQLLDVLTDVDDIATANLVAAEAPHTRFAAALAAARNAGAA